MALGFKIHIKIGIKKVIRRKGICKIQFHIDRTNDIVPLGEGEAVLEPVDDERGGAPRRPRRRAEQERVQQRVSGPQAGATALSATSFLCFSTPLVEQILTLQASRLIVTLLGRPKSVTVRGMSLYLGFSV